MLMDGSTDFETGAGEMSISSELSEIDPSLADIRMESVTPGFGTSYTSFGDLVDLPEGKEWVLITADDLGVSPEQALGGQDPTAGLDFLRGVVENPRPAGRDELRGESVDRYEVEVDLVALTEQLAEAAEEFAPTFAEQIGMLDEIIDGPLDGEVWIDDAGRVRRFTYTLEMDERGVELVVTTTLDYFDFGAPVDVVVPDPAEVVAFAEVEDELADFFGGNAPALSD